MKYFKAKSHSLTWKVWALRKSMKFWIFKTLILYWETKNSLPRGYYCLHSLLRDLANTFFRMKYFKANSHLIHYGLRMWLPTEDLGESTIFKMLDLCCELEYWVVLQPCVLKFGWTGQFSKCINCIGKSKVKSLGNFCLRFFVPNDFLCFFSIWNIFRRKATFSINYGFWLQHHIWGGIKTIFNTLELCHVVL